MRVDCKFYESRTYGASETVRMCRLDLAPEAPWRCPENCPRYERKIVDGGWVTGSLSNTPVPDEPAALDENAIRLLDEAENIINAVGPDVIDEINAQRAVAQSVRHQSWWSKFWPFGRR